MADAGTAGMSDLLNELSDLASDLRAVLEAEAARGVRVVPATTTARAVEGPPATPPPPAPTRPPAQRARTEKPAASAWADVAATARAASGEAVERGAVALQRIRDDLGDCRRCDLCKERRNIVYGVGDPEADLVIVGEGPGHDEDLKGEPFVGAAGQMLDKMIENVLGLSRQRHVYICNVVKCRPPGNRNPEPEEVAACRPFLERQILAIQPKVILVLGSVALKALLGTPQGIMKLRGSWQQWRGIPVLPTFHPAYLLRNPADKRKTFDDLKRLKQFYDTNAGRRD
jgi:DNA polymerase